MEVEEAMDGGLRTRTRKQYTSDVVPSVTNVENGDEQPSENSTYLNIRDAVEDLDLNKIISAVQNNMMSENEEKQSAIASKEETKGKSKRLKDEEIVEEELVELEFEKAVAKLNTHTMQCPNCNHQITKVVLRRKLIKRPTQFTDVPIKEKEEQRDLLGCFSCFSLFTSSDNGGFTRFPMFWNKPSVNEVSRPDQNEVVPSEDGNCFSIFRVFRREQILKKPPPQKVDQEYEQGNIGQADRQPSTTSDNIKYDNSKHPIKQGANGGSYVGGPSKPINHPSVYVRPQKQKEEKDDMQIDIDIIPEDSTEVPDHAPIQRRQDSTSFEILKSIVYGGLMEVIASLSVVASAAAGDATTMNIIALALANLVGGVLVIGHNLWDLRDDCYKFSSQQSDNQEPRNKYKELLGSVQHFPLHVFFAILSFLVFGIIPPLAYGYSFHETNDRDFTMLVVAVASFVCVGLLAIFKAYIDRCNTFGGYIKTITYYLTTAVAVSGVSYAVGSLVTRLIEELGLFETNPGVAASLLPKVVGSNPFIAVY
ncbi:uncharacterized protein [Rutidosis leptorrhynchoides]|uniref:uncharacterized protein n=1 Tax=Rutidosis leptorrhynchoides TaxID=125765 RepID=UPI003A9927B9